MILYMVLAGGGWVYLPAKGWQIMYQIYLSSDKSCQGDKSCGQNIRCQDLIPLWDILCWDNKSCSYMGSGDSSVVRAPDSLLKGCAFEPLQEWQENFLLLGQLSLLTLFQYSFHPRVTAVACKISRSFCQKCRWQVITKHACTLCMWLCMKWHGAWLYGVHRTCWDGSSFMWHQPCQRCKYTTLVDIKKCAIKS